MTLSRIRRCILTALAATMMTLAPASNASASAAGYSYWNGGNYKGIPLYSGQLSSRVSGSGTYVNYVEGSFLSAGNVCNWMVTAEFFDSNGKWYETKHSSTHWGCSKYGAKRVTIGKHVKKGTVCQSLRTNGARITSVCHSIH